MKKIVLGFLCCMLLFSLLLTSSALNFQSNINETNPLSSIYVDYQTNTDVSLRSDRDFSIYYVNDYCTGTTDLTLCDNDAEYIEERLEDVVDTPWTQRYLYGSYYSDGVYWEDTYENIYIDQNDLVVFRGHGTSGYDYYYADYIRGLKFRCDATETYFTPGDAHECYGDRDAEWIVLGCCQPLNDESRGAWAATMNGLHLILGFKTNADHKTYGTTWIQQCTSLNAWDPAKKIVWSWFKACDKKQSSGVVVRVIGEDNGMKYDYLWGEGTVKDDPTPNGVYVSWTHTKGHTISVPDKQTSNQQEMPLYSIIPKQVTPQYVQNIAGQFGISGEVGDGSDIEESYFMAIGSKSLEVSKVEGIDYGDTEKLWKPVENPPSLPSLDVAKTIATTFLTQTQLLPQDAGPASALYSDVMEIGNKGTTEILEEFPTDILVEFPRLINNEYPVIGGGSTCIVYISDGGEITGFTKIWRDLNFEGYVSTFDIGTAQQLFNQYGSQITLTGVPVIGYDSYTITNFTLGYYEAGFGDRQAYLIPVHLLFTDFHVGDETIPAILVIPASYDFLPPLVTITNPGDAELFPEGTSINFAGTADYGTNPYVYQWYSDIDGFLGEGPSLQVSNLTAHVLNGRPMGHTITLKVKDAMNHTGQASISVIITTPTNQPPLRPTITGPRAGRSGSEYSYTVQTTDPNTDVIYYRLDVVDGEESEPSDWFGPFPSGTPLVFNYTWLKPGKYTVSVQVKDIHNAESEWKSIKVTLYAVDISLVKKPGIGITAQVSNNDKQPFVENATIRFSLTNSVIIFGKEKNIPVPLPLQPDASITVKSGFIFGFGIANITVQLLRDIDDALLVEDIDKGLILGPFVLLT